MIQHSLLSEYISWTAFESWVYFSYYYGFYFISLQKSERIRVSANYVKDAFTRRYASDRSWSLKYCGMRGVVFCFLPFPSSCFRMFAAKSIFCWTGLHIHVHPLLPCGWRVFSFYTFLVLSKPLNNGLFSSVLRSDIIDLFWATECPWSGILGYYGRNCLYGLLHSRYIQGHSLPWFVFVSTFLNWCMALCLYPRSRAICESLHKALLPPHCHCGWMFLLLSVIMFSCYFLNLILVFVIAFFKKK